MEKRQILKLLLLSGGLDSTTAAYFLVKQGYSVEGIFFDYDRITRNVEFYCATELADDLNIRLHIIKIPLNQKFFSSVRPIVSGKVFGDIPDSFEMGVFTSLTTWLSLAFSYCAYSDINEIVLGVNADDLLLHPNLSLKYFENFEEIVASWTKERVIIGTPFISKTKSELVRIANAIGVPFKKTWSCSVSNEEHCGECDDCLVRAKAFMDAGIKDPLNMYRRKK